MSFFKRLFGGGSGGQPSRNGSGQGYLIEFDMMVKGSVYKRRSGLVRQFGVTVDGATRLVTSGDVVDRQTFEALVAVGAIRRPNPVPDPAPAPPAATPIKASEGENKKPSGKQKAV